MMSFGPWELTLILFYLVLLSIPVIIIVKIFKMEKRLKSIEESIKNINHSVEN